MAFLTPGASSVGMQVLLQTGSSSVFARGACNFFGTMYPVYKSFKAIETKKESDDDTQWLTYWTIYGALSLVEGTTDKFLSWFPYYYHAKLAFLLWLQLPQFQGAKKLYKDYMQPALKTYQPKVDYLLDVWQKNFGWMIEANQAQLQAMGSVLRMGWTSCIEFVKWFIDTSDKKSLGNIGDNSGSES